ncbi:MAG: PCRF domain-containing protein, partial [Candidatus Levybacteria bacterium]|nr:PCRF domain-containing protein [Candidatus Levybacteria bacterium]
MENLRERVARLLEKIDVSGKRSQIKQIEAESLSPDFWKDQQKATSKMKEMAGLQKEIENAKKLKELFELDRTKEAEKLLEELETLLYFSGFYDRSSALVSIHSGQGGVEAMDWTQMLYRMYARFAE